MTRTLARTCAPAAALLLTLLALAAAAPHDRAAASGKAGARASRPAEARPARIEKTLARPPASFEANAGQADGRVRFLSRGPGHALLLTAEGATLAFRTGDASKENAASRVTPRGESVRGARAESIRGAWAGSVRGSRGAAEPPSFRLVGMSFVGANPRAVVEGEGRLAGRVNYLVGRDPSKWRTGVPTFAGVRYRELYPGVDLVYHGGAGDRLEYDFVLAPGADPRRIRLRFDGVDSLSVGDGGELLLRTASGTMRQSAPFVYQQARGARRQVAGRYVLRGRGEVGFELGAYDPALALVIDPVLVYSSYVPYANRMAVGADGSVYLAGTAETYPGGPLATPGAFQTARRGSSDAFVARFTPDGSQLAYLTYLGGGDAGGPGTGFEQGLDVAVDAAGQAYVTGVTYSADFPLVNAFQPASGGGGSEGFVAKLNPSGSALVYSSYLGGSDIEMSKSVAVDSAGAAYVYGDTTSNDFPVKNALQPARKGASDLFLTKVAPDGGTLEYSTYLGGSDGEVGFLGDVAVDAAGAAYVAGTSYSSDYPVTPGAFQPATRTPAGLFDSDLVVTKVAPGGAALGYSTYLGGAGSDFCYGVAVDAAGQAHVVGHTGS
ncbi:MAG TPA: SBBP repeat-containing protein, partial [Pyrinomonadaceae bacterium]